MKRALLFSDVDGTLLSATGRLAVGPLALSRYAERIDIVLVSSRTLAELAPVQEAMGIRGPVVAENGAVLGLDESCDIPPGTERLTCIDREWAVVPLGTPSEVLQRELLDTAGQLAPGLELQAEDASETGRRRCSVAFRPPAGVSPGYPLLLSALRSRGRSVSCGGTWTVLTGGSDKGTGVAALLRHLPVGQRGYHVVAAVGDAENDEPLLRAVDHAFVIRGEDGRWHPSLAALSHATRLGPRGVAGWRTVVRCLARAVA